MTKIGKTTKAARRPRGGNGTTTQVSFRIPTDWLTRADAIARKISEGGAPPASPTDALRLALSRGFKELEREHAIGEHKKSGARS
jgi:hypothetical protein